MSVSPTEHIKRKILQPTGQTSATSAVSRALLTLFPSLECIQVPFPNPANPAADKVENLQTEFNSAIDKSVIYILSKIKPRNGVNNNVELDGVLLAKLADQYRKALNVPNSVPNLEDSYQTAVKHKINEHSKTLIECYKEEMEQKIPQNQYPLEEGNLDVTNIPSNGPITLFGIHNSIYQPKLNSLKMQVQKYMASSSFNNADRESVLNNFQDRICKIDNNEVQEGILYRFVADNLRKSRKHCDHVFERLYSAQSEVNLRDITSSYDKEAIGPAKTIVLEEKMSIIPKSIDFTEIVEEVHSVKVNWNYDPSLQDTVSYEVDIKMKQSLEKTCGTFPKGSRPPQSVSGLSPNTTYILRIRACNSTRKGEYSQEVTVKTLIGIPGIPDKPKIILDLDHPSKVAIQVKKLSKEKLNGAERIEQIIIEHSCHDDNDGWNESSFEVKTSCSSKPMKIPIELPTCPQECRCIYYRVRVVTAGGESEASDTEELFSADLIPGQPTNIKCSCDSEIKQAVLTWNAPEINSQSVNYYHIKVSRENGEEVYSREVTERRTVLNLRPATNYTVKLYACNHKKIKGTNSEFPIQMKAARPAKPKKPRIQVDNKDIRHAFLIVERPSNEEENGSAIKTIKVETAKGEDDREKWKTKEYDFTTGDRNIRLKVKLVNATDNNTMYFRVIMVNSVGPSEPSHHCELECYQMIPGEPQNVKVHQATNNSVTLKWDEPQVNPKSVDYYCVQMMDKNVNEWVLQSPVRTLKEKSFTVPNLCHNSPYKFRVLANNKDNESLPNGNVNIINTRTQPCPPKKPVHSNITLKVMDTTKAEVSVPRPNIEESGSDVAAIVCQKCTENGDEICCQEIPCIDNNEHIIKQIITIDDETHYIRVGLKNKVGCSQLSEYVCVSPSDIKPGPPQVNRVLPKDVTHNSLTLTWRPPKEQARAAKTYLVEVNESENEPQWRKAEYVYTVNSFHHIAEIKCLVSKTKYFFRVYALNGELKSLESNGVNATTKAGRPEKPDSPTITQVENNPDKALLVIQRLKKEKENGSTITKIKVDFCDENQSDWLLCEDKAFDSELSTPNISLEIEIPNIQNDKQFLFFRVKMINSVGESEPSEKCSLKAADLMPGGVGELKAVNTSESSTTLTWEVPKVHPGIVKRYTVECKESDEEGWKEVAKCNSDQKQCKITGLQCFKEYKYCVIACSNSRGPAITITIRTLDLLASAPNRLQLDRKWSDAIKIRWSKPLGGRETNDAYRVVLKDKKGEQILKTYYTTGHSKVLKDLESFTAYRVEVAGISKSKQISDDVQTGIFSSAMSGWGRFAATFAGSFGLIVGGVVTYHATKPDKKEYNHESDDECDEEYRKEVERMIAEEQDEQEFNPVDDEESEDEYMEEVHINNGDIGGNNEEGEEEYREEDENMHEQAKLLNQN